MTVSRNHKALPYLVEIAKWLLVLWLIWPLTQAFGAPIHMGRVALGIALFVIFAGKLFYDVVFFQRQRKRGGGSDLVTTLGIVLGMTFIVGVFLLLLVLFVINYRMQ